MSEDAKKPARKKAAPRGEAPKAERMDDQTAREAVLAAALPHAAFDGFTDSVLQKAAMEAGVKDAARLFENGPISLVEFYSTWADTQMEAKLAATDLKAMKIRARIAAAVKARLSVLAPHKEAARRAAALLSLPMHAALGAKLVYRTVDAMWRASGDTSTDFNFYTKRGLLAGVYAATVLFWLNDRSADSAETWAFLDRRIADVLRVPPALGRLGKLAGQLPNPFRLFRAVRR